MPQDPVIYSSNLQSGLTINSPSLQTPTVVRKIESLVAAKTLTAADSGKVIFLNLAGGFTVTLPAVSNGLWFRFVIKTSPTTAYIITAADGAYIGGFNELEVDTGDDGPYTSTGTNINFTANVAVIGDYAELISDGANWYVEGQTNADGGVTFS